MANAMYGKAGVAAMALVLGAAGALAQSGTTGGGSTGSAVTNSTAGGASAQDKTFLKESSQGGMLEIQAGKLAAQKGQADDVKQFGQMMVTDHTQLNQQMMPVMVEAGVKPPTALPAKDKKILAKLQGLNGDAFDKAYITAMLKDHEEDQKEFQMESTSGQLPSEKAAASQGQGMIDTHLEKIKQIAQAHNVTQS